MLNTDFRLQIPGKPFGNLSAYPILAIGGLNENIHGCNKEQQCEKKPKQYFLKSLQGQLFSCKNRHSYPSGKFSTNKINLKGEI